MARDTPVRHHGAGRSWAGRLGCPSRDPGSVALRDAGRPGRRRRGHLPPDTTETTTQTTAQTTAADAVSNAFPPDRAAKGPSSPTAQADAAANFRRGRPAGSRPVGGGPLNSKSLPDNDFSVWAPSDAARGGAGSRPPDEKSSPNPGEFP